MSDKDPFVFSYARIREQGGMNARLSPAPELFADAFEAADKLKKLDVELDFSVGGDSVLLEGKVRAEVELPCSRCGDPVTRVFEDSFDEVYPDSVEYIDTREAVRETAALLVPIKVLCSETCKGRCLVCGVNRNRQTCSCRPGHASQFDALKGLKLGPGGDGKKKI